MSETNGSNLMGRRAVVARLLQDRGDDLLVVSGLGNASWDITAAGDHPLNFPMWGAMGSAASVGLGLALAQPDRRVLVITGDGEMLMGLGTLPTIAAQAPENLSLVVIDNEHYTAVGTQGTHTSAGTDLAAMAAAAGLPVTGTAHGEEELEAAWQDIRAGKGPVFYVVKVRAETLPKVLPPRDGVVLKHRFRAALLGEDRA